MTVNNAYFKHGDPYSLNVAGFELHPEWWSRHYEYLWALRFAEPDHVCADMGCGWMQRPFKDMLAKTCKAVYAVDADKRVMDLPHADNLTLITADITKDTGIQEASLDRVYCISVLEDLPDLAVDALREFRRIVKPDGLIIVTCDAQYDITKPLAKYPAINLVDFIRDVLDAGLEFVGDYDTDKTDAVYHPEWNLCCWHCVLRRA